MKKSTLKYSISLILIAIAVAGVLLYKINSRYATDIPPAVRISPPPTSTPTPSPTSKPTLPVSKFLDVPFTPQAPTANWDELHGEACEEASSIMAWAYFNNDNENEYDKNQDGTLDPKFVEEEITKLTEWEKENFGYYLDINSEETAKMIREVYGLEAEVDTSYTETDIKQYISEGKLVLIPAQGQQLGNPNYRRPGPPYHMLVIKGYTSKEFITNDPGTRRGASYPYTFDVLYNANGDWQHSSHSVDTSKKMIIIVSK